jgi:hypothetical protein
MKDDSNLPLEDDQVDATTKKTNQNDDQEDKDVEDQPLDD